MKHLYQSAVSSLLSATVMLGIPSSVKAITLTGNTDTIQYLFATKYTNSIDANLARKLQTVLDKNVEKSGIPGATVAILTPQGMWFGASGFSNLKNQTAMLPRDRFNIASVSKPFTAATVLSLVDEGKLNLEDKLDKWLPASVVANIPNGNDITIRQLLNHTSGIPDYSENPEIVSNPLNLYSRDWSQEELVTLVKQQQPKNAPGQGFYYSATNYLLSAMIVESATNSTFASAVRSRILEPLGLKDTFVLPQEPLPPDVVSGYITATDEQRKTLPADVVQFLDRNFDFVDDGQNTRLYDAKPLLQGSRGYGAGSIVSTAADVAKFGNALFNGKLLKPETLKEMLTFIDTGNSLRNKYGLGVYPTDTLFGTILGHDGQNPGYISRLGYLPEYDITVVALVNERNDYLVTDPSQISVDRLSQTVREKILQDSLQVLLKQKSKPVPDPQNMAGLMVLGATGIFWTYVGRRKIRS